MKSNQASFARRTALVGLLAGSAVLAASAYAVSADRAPCVAGQQQQGEARWEDRRAAHLAVLKEKLALTATQEPAWNAFVEATQRDSRHHGMERGSMHEAVEKLGTPERRDRMQAMAVKAFYAELSAEQQRVFDAEAMPMRHREHRHHRHPS